MGNVFHYSLDSDNITGRVQLRQKDIKVSSPNEVYQGCLGPMGVNCNIPHHVGRDR